MSHGLVTDTRITREELLALRERPVHVVGAASAEGVAVLRLLTALGFTQLTVHDMRERATLRRAFRTTHGAYSRTEQDEIWDTLAPTFDANGKFGDDYLATIGDAELVVLGQGWYLVDDNRRRLVEGIAPDARIVGMSELYFALHGGPIAGITGTNGKSTTVALTEHLLQYAEVPHATAGNERSSRQFLPWIDEITAGTWALLEVSNRQLLQLDRSPQVAAITALTPDHLDEHGGIAGYQATKARLFTGQAASDVAIANADDPDALAAALQSPAADAGRLVRAGVGAHAAPSVTWRDGELVAMDMPRIGADGSLSGEVVLATEDDLNLPGTHNLRNAAVAAAVALACGADPARIAPGLRSFEGKALRLQLLDTLEGIEVWSDIKSTTPEATVAALEALTARPNVVLIAGGDDKGLDYAALAARIVAQGVRVVAVPGSATTKLELELGQLPDGAARFTLVEDLEQALDRAFDGAASGDAVIVSPAAAGFWTRYLQGGSSLQKLVRQRARALQEVPGQ
ncbi:MAG: UDP-N-acetylmuramoyl-L-alanyl-D-glutamate synthetase [Thermoleophilia bacterium]|nr:UDP-N-acetylmuramoyl-L-alanyl-D-glutamate synthetase [Thermoleophilia bacterium]